MAGESVKRLTDLGKGEFVNPHTGEIVDNDAIEIGGLYEKARTSIVESVRYQIECGSRLIAKKESMAHGEWLPWLESNAGVLGFSSRRTAQMLMKAAGSNAQLTSHLDEAQAAQISRQTWGNLSSQLVQQSLSNEHYTPAKYLDAAREVLGAIDLDPASCEEANEAVMAARYFAADDDADGLSQDWHGRVWLNPPYGDLVGQFITKLTAEYAAGNVAAAIALVNAHCTDTCWFQQLWDGILCFTDHRINFYGDDTRSGSTHGSVFVYFGDQSGLFIERFSEFGAVLCRARP